MEFRVVALLRYNLGNNVSDASHFECSLGPHVSHICISSGVTDGGAGAGTTPCITKCKNWAAELTVHCISVLVFLWFSAGCRFFPFFGSFSEYFTVI